MARQPLTWQQVSAPDYSQTIRANESAAKSFNDAVAHANAGAQVIRDQNDKAIANQQEIFYKDAELSRQHDDFLLRSRADAKNQEQTNTDGAFLARAASFSNPRNLERWLSTEDAIKFGASASAVAQAKGMVHTGIANQGGYLTNDRAQYGYGREQRDNQSTDAAYKAFQGIMPGVATQADFEAKFAEWERRAKPSPETAAKVRTLAEKEGFRSPYLDAASVGFVPGAKTGAGPAAGAGAAPGTPGADGASSSGSKQGAKDFSDGASYTYQPLVLSDQENKAEAAAAGKDTKEAKQGKPASRTFFLGKNALRPEGVTAFVAHPATAELFSAIRAGESPNRTPGEAQPITMHPSKLKLAEELGIDVPDLTLPVDATVADVLAKQREVLHFQRKLGIDADSRNSAYGDYQFTYSTLNDGALLKAADVEITDNFFEAQEKLAAARLLRQLSADGNLKKLQDGTITADELANSISSVWAAVTDSTGKGTYDNDNNNNLARHNGVKMAQAFLDRFYDAVENSEETPEEAVQEPPRAPTVADYLGTGRPNVNESAPPGMVMSTVENQPLQSLPEKLFSDETDDPDYVPETPQAPPKPKWDPEIALEEQIAKRESILAEQAKQSQQGQQSDPKSEAEATAKRVTDNVTAALKANPARTAQELDDAIVAKQREIRNAAGPVSNLPKGHEGDSRNVPEILADLQKEYPNGPYTKYDVGSVARVVRRVKEVAGVKGMSDYEAFRIAEAALSGNSELSNWFTAHTVIGEKITTIDSVIKAYAESYATGGDEDAKHRIKALDELRDGLRKSYENVQVAQAALRKEEDLNRRRAGTRSKQVEEAKQKVTEAEQALTKMATRAALTHHEYSLDRKKSEVDQKAKDKLTDAEARAAGRQAAGRITEIGSEELADGTVVTLVDRLEDNNRQIRISREKLAQLPASSPEFAEELKRLKQHEKSRKDLEKYVADTRKKMQEELTKLRYSAKDLSYQMSPGPGFHRTTTTSKPLTAKQLEAQQKYQLQVKKFDGVDTHMMMLEKALAGGQ